MDIVHQDGLLSSDIAAEGLVDRVQGFMRGASPPPPFVLTNGSVAIDHRQITIGIKHG